MKKNLARKEKSEYPKEVVCANPKCGKKFIESPYGALCNCIMGHKPVCSFECNKAIGQV